MWHRRSILLTALAPVALAPVAMAKAAAQPSPQAPIDELMRRLAQVRESRARFVEDKTIAALAQPVRSEGWLVYRRPGHLEKVTTSPVPESLMVDGDRLSVIVDGQPPRIIDLAAEPALGALVEAVRGTLAGDLPALRRSYAVSMRGDLASWQIALAPSGKPLTDLLRQVLVDGAGPALRRVAIEQANGDRSVMSIAPAA